LKIIFEMNGYYRDQLAAERLKRCYYLASERVRQYLDAEVSHVIKKIAGHEKILELGCGYGRFIEMLFQEQAKLSTNFEIYGIDSSFPSLRMCRESRSLSQCRLICMDVARYAFKDNSFDAVVCIQNGISAFHVDKKAAIEESLRIARKSGIILFSSYSEKFWKYRLEWFEAQSSAGLLGPIDYERTGNGVIICKDGFSATTIGPQEFMELTDNLEAVVNIEEVDESSLFCEIIKK
jgi:ubiquinone/menaquinone biosynthesis C-methylase UbiE